MSLPPEFWDDPKPNLQGWEESNGAVSTKVLSPDPVKPGQPVFLQNGKVIGTIQSWTPAAGGKVEAVAAIIDPDAIKAFQTGTQMFSMGVSNVRLHLENFAAIAQKPAKRRRSRRR